MSRIRDVAEFVLTITKEWLRIGFDHESATSMVTKLVAGLGLAGEL
jgi:hypothetical protein